MSVHFFVFLCADEAFTAMQFIATVLCSMAVLVLSVAFFRPEKASRGSVGTVAFVGTILMGLYAFFQFLAFVLVAVLGDEAIFDYMGERLRVDDVCASCERHDQISCRS